MIQKDYNVEINYNKGFEISMLFILVSSGITTSNDDLLSDFTRELLNEKLINNDIIDVDDTDFYNVAYKPFDNKVFCLNSKYSMRSRETLIKNYKTEKKNFSLNFRKTAENTIFWQHIFLTNYLIEGNFLSARSFCIPLYLYPSSKNKDLFVDGLERKPNLNPEIVKQITEQLGLAFHPEHPRGLNPLGDRDRNTDFFTPIDILDYIYAVLHSPTYREKYKEFLKIDFLRVPYPKDVATFWQLVKLGGQIREIHLLESPVVENYITQYPIDGNKVVGKIFFEANPVRVQNSDRVVGRVYINYVKTSPSGGGGLQYFDNVPQVAWKFYIGGYQPAQKWLKDRKDRKLEFEDILHYQKIIVALSETDRLMKEIDTIDVI